MKKAHKVVIVLALAVAVWLLLPELVAVSAVLMVLVAKLLVLGIALSFLGFLVWLIGPRELYRRYIAGYVRLRRMRRNQHLRQWREAAERGHTEE